MVTRVWILPERLGRIIKILLHMPFILYLYWNPQKFPRGKVFRVMESVNILGYGNIIGTDKRFNRG